MTMKPKSRKAPTVAKAIARVEKAQAAYDSAEAVHDHTASDAPW